MRRPRSERPTVLNQRTIERILFLTTERVLVEAMAAEAGRRVYYGTPQA